MLSHSLLQVQVRITNGPIGATNRFLNGPRPSSWLTGRRTAPDNGSLPQLHLRHLVLLQPHLRHPVLLQQRPLLRPPRPVPPQLQLQPRPLLRHPHPVPLQSQLQPQPRCQALLRHLNPVPRQPQFLFQPRTPTPMPTATPTPTPAPADTAIPANTVSPKDTPTPISEPEGRAPSSGGCNAPVGEGGAGIDPSMALLLLFLPGLVVLGRRRN